MLWILENNGGAKGLYWGFWQSGADMLIYEGFILLAEALWHLVDYGLNAKTAAQINERIRKNRLEKRTGKES